MEIACILLIMLGVAAPSTMRSLRELTVQHPHVKPQSLSAGSRLLDRGRSASVKADRSRNESGEGEEAGHLQTFSSPGSRLSESRSHTLICLLLLAAFLSLGWSTSAPIPAPPPACHPS